MAANDGYRRTASTKSGFSLRSGTGARLATLLIAILLLSLTCPAQPWQTALQPELQAPANPGSGQEAMLTVPAGTKISVVLTRSFSSKSMRPGDDVYAQTTFPVTVGNDVAIPQGSFVQGKIEKVARKGSRGDLQLQAASVIFANGYVAGIPGLSDMESDAGTAFRDPGSGTKAGAVAVSAVPVVGMAAAILMLHNVKDFVLDAGSPMEIVLQQPLLLDRDRVAEAVLDTSAHPPVPVPVPRRRLPPPVLLPASTDTGTCYTPGTPGTPDIYIPGTPSIGDMPGTPGTVIPGIPPTPPTPHPCP